METFLAWGKPHYGFNQIAFSLFLNYGEQAIAEHSTRFNNLLLTKIPLPLTSCNEF